jgi:small subunit ribosomal protein S16
MLAIRMQRTGRKGHAMFRVIVQDSRRTPSSGKIVEQLGSYDPHAKAVILNKEKASYYLEHGAQPSDRVVRLLKSEGVTLPKWVAEPAAKERTVRNPEKRRSTRPEEPQAEVTEAPAEEVAPVEETAEAAEPTEAEATEAPAEEAEAEAESTEAAEPTEEAPEATEAPAEEAPAEEAAEEATTEAPAESSEEASEDSADKPA